MDDSTFIDSFYLSSEDEPEPSPSRTQQSEADFQTQKASWKPKIDSREVLRAQPLTTLTSKELERFKDRTVESKFDVVGKKELSELLYYERRYEEAVRVAEEAVRIDDAKGLRGSDKAEVEEHIRRCKKKLLKKES
jgi:hypothetical protein